MFAVHAMFRREFGLMSQLIRDVAEGDRARVALVADHVALMTLVLHEHHSGEDEHVWPRLHARASREMTPLIDLMEEQHCAIHASSSDVAEALDSWRQRPSAQTRDALADAIDQLVTIVKRHMTDEELRVVPLIE